MKEILLIARIPPNNASTIRDHVVGYQRFSKYSVRIINPEDLLLGAAIESADCIILHYSVVAYPYREDYFINSKLRLSLSFLNKPLLHIVQDEQRNIMQRFRYFESIGVRHVFSVAPKELYDLMYPVSDRSFSVSTLLTGYVPLDIENWKPKQWEERSIDISYRSRRLPKWYGILGSNKSAIADKLNEFKKFTNLSIDASCNEEDRIYDVSWIEFLCDSKVAIGTESGSSILDFDGRYKEAWQHKASLGKYSSESAISANYATSSPRIFEYAAAKCLLALTPGKYSGILTANVHYFEILPDLSNLDDLVLLMSDPNRRNQMINLAYEELILSGKYSYRTMALAIDQEIERIIPSINLVSEFENRYKPNPKRDLNYLKKANSRDILNLTKLGNQKYSKRNILINWFINQKGAFRFTLRLIYRFFLWSKSLLKGRFVILSIFSDSKARRELKLIFKYTRRPIIASQILPELQKLRNESQVIGDLGFRLSTVQTKHAFWISWQEKLSQDSRLKNHPFLDYYKFPEANGVWFTRSDFSEKSTPLKLEYLSKYYIKNKGECKKLIAMFCNL